MPDDQDSPPESLLPYQEWMEEALRQVVVRAIERAATQGLPGEHHFYITFRTDYPGAAIPDRLRAQYPSEMTIVLQHQFWDLKFEDGAISVGLSFGGVPAGLRIPLGSIVAFADPHARYGLRFQPVDPDRAREAAAPAADAEPEAPAAEAEAAPAGPTVVSLDAFRRRPPSKS
jgi:hypothetical protein